MLAGAQVPMGGKAALSEQISRQYSNGEVSISLSKKKKKKGALKDQISLPVIRSCNAVVVMKVRMQKSCFQPKCTRTESKK
jgi:hypothetical protein